MRTTLLVGIFALALAFGGCGDGGNSDFSSCGNGNIDSGEACDDGNLEDTDSCLSTCQPNVCGDGYVDAAHEECDGHAPECGTLHEGDEGTTNCLRDCTLLVDCHPRTNAPTPTSVPGTPTVTATPTPTIAPTPVGSVCNGSEAIVVTLALDADVTSAALNLGYGSSVNLPGSGSTDPAIKDRVEFAGSGLTVVNDFDGDDDLTDDTITTGLVGTDVVAAGTFVTVTFDCVGGEPVPTAASFVCTVVSASLNENTVEPSCTVGLQ